MFCCAGIASLARVSGQNSDFRQNSGFGQKVAFWSKSGNNLKSDSFDKSALTHVMGQGSLTEMHFLTETALFDTKDSVEPPRTLLNHRGLSVVTPPRTLSSNTTEDSVKPGTVGPDCQKPGTVGPDCQKTRNVANNPECG